MRADYDPPAHAAAAAQTTRFAHGAGHDTHGSGNADSHYDDAEVSDVDSEVAAEVDFITDSVYGGR